MTAAAPQFWIDDSPARKPCVGEVAQPLMLPVFGRKLATYQLAREYVAVTLFGIFRIPAGLITDGASAPWFAWSLGFLPDGLHRPGALVHDYLYALKGLVRLGELTRRQCDDIFRDLMIRAGVHPTRAQIMHRCVRLFGWLPWSRATGPVIEPLHYQIS